MRMFRMLYLVLLSSLLGGCSSAYQHLRHEEGNTDCIQKFIPSYQRNWFTASIDVRGHHLSGLLLIKKMPDGADRIVFTNELGVSFFDFEFSDADFKALQVIDKLNIKPVLNTLREDFELLLLTGLDRALIKRYATDKNTYYTYQWHEKINYIISNDECVELVRLERGSEKKKLVQIEFEGDQNNPDKITVQHFNFNMQIVLTKIER